MSHTNSTANLSLPQFIGTDKPTWLSDVNGAFAAIDSYAGSNDAALAITDGKADTAIADASNAVTTAGNAATTAGNAAATATAANTVAGNALTVANGINAKVSVLTDLTTTDKSTVVNAINEVNAKDAADIAYDNTVSGLSATDVQNAIDEIAGGGSSAGCKLLWKNAGGLTTFAPQTVTINDYDYEGIQIAVDFSGGSGEFASVVLNINNDAFSTTSKIFCAYVNSSDQAVRRYRGITITLTGTTLSIDFAGGYSGATADNAMAIPTAIIGIK